MRKHTKGRKALREEMRAAHDAWESAWRHAEAKAYYARVKAEREKVKATPPHSGERLNAAFAALCAAALAEAKATLDKAFATGVADDDMAETGIIAIVRSMRTIGSKGLPPTGNNFSPLSYREAARSIVARGELPAYVQFATWTDGEGPGGRYVYGVRIFWGDMREETAEEFA